MACANRYLHPSTRVLVATLRRSAGPHKDTVLRQLNHIKTQKRLASSYRGKYFFIDRDLINVPASQFKDIQSAAESDTYVDGDIIEAWDHVFRWNSNCVPLRTWKEWRHLGDSLADEALPIIAGPAGSGGGTDMLARLEAAVKQENPDPKIMRFWDALHEGPKQDLWPDEAQILRGQAIYWRYAPQIASALLHYSLAAGFSSPRIARILNLASYLVPPMSSSPDGAPPKMSKASIDRSFMRLMETTQWLMHCMSPGAMNVGGTGWSSTVRVRLLHTTMRRRLLEKSRREWETKGHSVYNEKTDGTPISQEDFMATQCAFACAPLFCLSKQGITPTAQECEDWTALWRVIGYYFGIQPDLLIRHFGSWEKSKAIGSSVVAAMFAGESDPPPPADFPFDRGAIKERFRIKPITPANHQADPYLTPATLPVLFCISKRWPIYFSFSQHCAAARHLTGQTLSDWLSIPKSSWIYWARYRFGTWMSSLPPRFARIYRSAWDEKRRNAMMQSLEGAIKFELGHRTSKFRPRKPGAFEPEKEGDEFHGVDQGSALGGLFGTWVRLYGEVAAVFALFAGLFTLPGAVYWQWKKQKKPVEEGM